MSEWSTNLPNRREDQNIPMQNISIEDEALLFDITAISHFH